MISGAWLLVILVHSCNAQLGHDRLMSFMRPNRPSDYRGSGGLRGRWSLGPGPRPGPPPFHSGYQGRGRRYNYREPPPIQYSRDHSRSYDRRRPATDYGDVFAGRYEQFGPSPPRLETPLPRRHEPPPRRHEPPPRRNEPPPRRHELPSRRHEQPSRRIKHPSRRSEQPSRRNKQTSRRQAQPSRRRQPSRPSRERQTRREEFREGYVGATGGQDGFPLMGGYCAGEMCRDGGQLAGVGNGIGTGSLAEFERRRRTGETEDVRLYEMHVGGPSA